MSAERSAMRLVLGDWPSLQPDASRVREAVFVREQGIPIELEWDEWDPRSLHCVAYDDGRAVATGRLLPDGHIGRMAVLKPHRSTRLGGKVLEALIAAGRERGHRSFELSAQQYVAHFYRRHGFAQIGEPYDEVGIPHVRMRLDDSLPRQGEIVERAWETKRPDGTRLFQREWLPAEDRPNACVYLFHGLGEHSGRYAALARQLCAWGWQVRAHDHRGHGRSGGRRGALAQPNDLLDDGLALLAEFHDQCGQKPVLFGHSLGGALAAQLAVAHQARLRALALSSPALQLSLSSATRWKIRLMNRLAPELGVPNGLDASKLSHDPAAVQAYRNDPLVHDRVTGRLLTWLLAAGEQALAQAPSLAIPILLLVAGSDQVVDPAGSRSFVERAATAPLTLKWYDGLSHELIHERAADRLRVIDDLRGWLASLPR
ncbi:MAG: GNAT family N-acetyltransferase [Burkholderiaceae bacterium]